MTLGVVPAASCIWLDDFDEFRTSRVPDAWTCREHFYDERHASGQSTPVNCDCGCGAPDPDCAGEGCQAPGCHASACESCFIDGPTQVLCGMNNVPWACPLIRYGDGFCDCGCGSPDPDCAGAGCAQAGCQDTDGCSACTNQQGRQVVCGTASTWWDCDDQLYAEATRMPSTTPACNCGCSSIDPDCGQGGCAEAGCQQDACDTCVSSGLLDVDCVDAKPPAGWSCPPIAWADDRCDCGCGVEDFDCRGRLGCTTRDCMGSGCDFTWSAQGG
ncbi:MAG: hypothetical protein MJD61_05305 [Proteobacteria bacterium]|nr:hypothetical protein [Pseudomonadota bacterium]